MTRVLPLHVDIPTASRVVTRYEVYLNFQTENAPAGGGRVALTQDLRAATIRPGQQPFTRLARFMPRFR